MQEIKLLSSHILTYNLLFNSIHESLFVKKRQGKKIQCSK